MEPLQDPEGHRWVKPTGPDCPHCDCCTKRLCDKARQHILKSCAHVADPGDFDTVKHCPCSAVPWPEPANGPAEQACVWCQPLTDGAYADECTCERWCGSQVMDCKGATR